VTPEPHKWSDTVVVAIAWAVLGFLLVRFWMLVVDAMR
jgi:hypothetical protein